MILVHSDDYITRSLGNGQGAGKGGRQKEFDHFFRFWGSFGHFLVTFSDASVTFSSLFFAKLLLPESFCGRVKRGPQKRVSAIDVRIVDAGSTLKFRIRFSP